MKIITFWDVTPCNLYENYKVFAGTCSPELQSGRVKVDVVPFSETSVKFYKKGGFISKNTFFVVM
jgi:hypothetical protein